MKVSLNFNVGQAATDPAKKPVLIIGQMKHLQAVEFDQVKSKLEPRVSEETWSTGVSRLNPSPTDSVSLYINLATVAALPTKCSRHNTSSRAHAITKLVKANTTGQDETIVIVCDRSDVYASGCAVSRAFPVFCRKTEEADSKKSNTEIVVNIEFLLSSGEPLTETDMSVLQHSARGIRLAALIVDTPCNEMHTDRFLDMIRDVGTDLNIVPTIIQGEELNEKGFGGIYGVGKAALHQPALAILSHMPEGATETVAWVGKGIVYDTGGLSIKGKTAMPGMKRDCGGAAGILGAFFAAVREGFSENLHAVFCLAENAVGPKATRPDDVHVLYSGRTVEINNTDAEGRLVLADGVAYANKDLKANIIVDMCTLTGAQGVATGRYHAAHMTNREEWELWTLDAGRASGDLSFPLVYCPEMHFSEFSSAVADMKNSVADRNNATSSCAGLFINANLGFDYPGVWLHVDMASPVHSGERATGYGVALLNTLFGRYSKSVLLKEAAPHVSADGLETGTKYKKMRHD